MKQHADVCLLQQAYNYLTWTLNAVSIIYSNDSKLKDSHLNSWILIYNELNVKKTGLSEGPPFQSLFGWLILSSGGLNQGPRMQNLLWSIIYNFGFKLNLSSNFFCK